MQDQDKGIHLIPGTKNRRTAIFFLRFYRVRFRHLLQVFAAQFWCTLGSGRFAYGDHIRKKPEGPGYPGWQFAEPGIPRVQIVSISVFGDQ